MSLGFSAGALISAFLTGAAQVPLLRRRIVRAGWWPFVSGAGLATALVVGFGYQSVLPRAGTDPSRVVFVVVPVLLIPLVHASVEALFLSRSLDPRAWLVARVAVGAIPLPVASYFARTGIGSGSSAAIGVLFGALALLPPTLLGLTLLRLTTLRGAMDAAPGDDDRPAGG